MKISLAGTPDAEMEVTLFDQTGRKVYNAKHQPTGAHAEIDLDLADLSLPAGIYLLRISGGSNYHKATKVYRH